MKWWNNGSISVRSIKCPDGFKSGRLTFKRSSPSVETRQKISNSNKGRSPWNKGIKTGPQSEDIRERKRLAASSRDNSVYKGRVPWNKGLDSTDPRILSYAAKQRGQNRNGNYVRGVDHPGFNPERDAFLKYRTRVALLTERNYAKHCNAINPSNFPRTLAGVDGGYQLDHIKSVYSCWLKGVDEETAASVDNLQMLPWIDNIRKGKK